MLLHRGTLPGSARAACFRSHKCLAAPRLQPQASRGLQVRCAVPAEPVTLNGEGSHQLALNVAKEATAKGLVHRYLVTVRQNARQGSANTKTRAEVRGGGKKPYKQKGTGNARQGSKSSPLLRGGGVVFGPKPKDYSIKMNRKEKKVAMATALQSAAPSMTVVKPMKEAVTQPKTKLLKQTLEAAGVGKDEHVLIVLNELTEAILLAARNVQQITLNAADRLNVYDVLRADKIVVEDASLQYIQEYYGAQKA